jgi:hypothetical protein
MAKAPTSDLISPQEVYASHSAEIPPVIIDVRGLQRVCRGPCAEREQYHVRQLPESSSNFHVIGSCSRNATCIIVVNHVANAVLPS